MRLIAHYAEVVSPIERIRTVVCLLLGDLVQWMPYQDWDCRIHSELPSCKE